ncbi:MAG: polysaccharide biosynthesis protein [Chloroflexota bacterium]
MRRPFVAWLTSVVRRYVPWVAIDLPLVWVCYALGILLRGTTAELNYPPALLFGVIASALVVVCNEIFGVYRRWWRYATGQDVMILVLSVACATAAVVGADLFWPGPRPMPLGAVLVGSFLALAGMIATRYRSKPLSAIRTAWRRLRTDPRAATSQVLIVGAGEAGQLLAWQLKFGPHAEHHNVVGFIDDDDRKLGMIIHGCPVLGKRDAIPRVARDHDVSLIVIAIHQISGPDFREILDICRDTEAQIKQLPNVFGTFGEESDETAERAGEDLAGQSLFGDITIEDLLGRHPVSIDREQCRHLVGGKTVLVTGASGSIGSELCRQLAELRPARLVMLDSNESGLHDLSVALQGYRSDDTAIVPVIGDVTHENRLAAIFRSERPQVVFHTAAYKHVPLMEDYPEEAVRVNVGGTRAVMRLAAEVGAERFVLVSSDKAVEPSSVMGATKRVCELMAGAMGGTKTLFTAVRFGNVLASRGSVVPTFNRQIDMGGPVTITDPRMQRYFMSLTEAASLVIQAANFTEGGDTFILDMGEELNMLDLARRLIRLRGLRPDVDIPIVITGPRPGEKLREVLAGEDERTTATPHPRVLRIVATAPPPAPAAIEASAARLLATAATGERAELRAELWALARGGVAPSPVAIAPASRVSVLPEAPRGPLDEAVAGASDAEPTGGRPSTLDQRPETAPAIGWLGRAADTVVRLEPWLVIPAAAALLLYPNPLVELALVAIALPWLARLARVGSPTAATPFDLPLGLFVAGAAVGLAVTTSPRWAAIRISGLLAGAALFYLIVNQVTTRERLRAYLSALLAIVAVAAVLLTVLVAPFLPAAALLPGEAVGAFNAATDGARQWLIGADDALERYRFRASGLGALAAYGMALTIGPAIAGIQRTTRRVGFGLAILFGLVVVLSGSRGSIASMAALGITLLALRSAWFVAAVPAVLVGVWLLVERGSFGLAPPDAVPLPTKIQFWQNSFAILHDYALTGVGLGLRSARDAYQAYFPGSVPRFSHAHNMFVQAYLEQGLLGCVGFVGIAAGVFFQGRRIVSRAPDPLLWGIALSSTAAAMVLFFEGLTEIVLLTSFGTVMLMLPLGLLVATARVGRLSRPRQRGPAGGFSWRRPIVAMPILSAFSVATGLAVAFTPLGGSLQLNLGAAERLRATLQDGLTRDERLAGLERAEGYLARGLELDGRDPALWRNLAEVSVARGDVAEARQALRRARELTASNDGFNLYQLGRVYREAGLWADAVRAWREARAVDALTAWTGEQRVRTQPERLAAIWLAIAELRPDDPDAVRQYVQAARAARQPQELTMAEISRLAQTSNAAAPLLELAKLYDEAGRTAEAASARAEAEARAAQTGQSGQTGKEGDR